MAGRHRTRGHWGAKLAVALAVGVGVLAGGLIAWAYFSATSPAQNNAFTAAPVDHLTVTPSTATITAGSTQTYTVTAWNATNTASWTVTGSSTFSISPDGSCTANTCTATTAGTHTVTASFWGVSATATLTIGPATAAKLAFLQSPSSSSGGVTFATQPIVAIEDTYGNIVTTDTSSITLSITTGTPTSGGPGTLTCTTNPLAAIAGKATFTGCSINTIGTNYRLHAVDGTLTPADSAPFSITGGTLDHFVVSNPGTQTAGGAFTVTVSAVDAGGNVATGWTAATLCVTFTGAASSPNATPPLYPTNGACPAGQSALTFNSAGQATATITLYNAQTLSLTVTSNSTPTGKTGSTGTFTVNPAPLDHFTVTNPGTQTAGTAFTETITALDAWGNVAAGWTFTTNCVTFTGPASSPNGTPPLYPAPGSCAAGQSALTFSSAGQATASVTLYDAQTTSLTVTANSTPAGKSGSSGSVTVTAAALDTFTVPTPSTQTAGVAFTETITAIDLYGNPASGWTSTTTCVNISDPNASPNGTAPLYPAQGPCAAGDSQLTFNAAGQATASITLYDAQTTTLSVSDPTFTWSGSSTFFTVNPAAATTVTLVSGSGQTTTVNTAFTNPLGVSVTDTYANPVQGTPVTFTAPSTGASATFASTGCTSNPQTYSCVVTADSTGIATSSVFTANATGGSYTITANASGTNTVNFTETNAASGVLHISSLITGATTGTTSWNASVTVTVKDSSGNPVSGVTVTGTWSPTTTATPSGCTTNTAGQCTITTISNFPSTQTVETWTVTNLGLSGYTYSAASNVESSITVARGCPAATVCAVDLGANAFDTTASTSATTTTLNGTNGTAPSNATVLLLITRDGRKSGDTVASINGSAISSPALVQSVTSNLTSNKKTFTNLWVYRAIGTGTTAGTVTVTFNNTDNFGTLVQAVVLAGANSTTPIAQSGPVTCTTACTKAATASLTSPSATNGEVLLLAEAKDTGTATTTSTTGLTQMFWNHVASGNGFNASTWSDSAAQATSNFTLGTNAPWGSIAVEVTRSQ